MTDEFDFTTGLPSSEMEAYLQLYLDETTEQLDALVESLLILEQEPHNPTQLNEVFRLIHSIKGSAAMMGLESITVLTHRLENHFERLRNGVGKLQPETMALILKCIDFLRHCNDRLRAGQPLASEPELLDDLGRLTEGTIVTSPPTKPPTSTTPGTTSGATTSRTRESEVKGPEVTSMGTPVTSDTASASEEEHRNSSLEAGDSRDDLRERGIRHGMTEEHRNFRISIQFEPEVQLVEVKAELIWTRMEELGTVLASNPPRRDFVHVNETFLLQFAVSSDHGADELWAAADIVGVARIEVEEDVPELTSTTSDETIVNSPSETLGDFNEATASDTNIVAAERPAQTIAQPEAAALPSLRAGEATDLKSKVADTLRVDVDRLDNLMNLVGELVINQARFVQLARLMSPALRKSNLAAQARSLSERLRRHLPNADRDAVAMSSTSRLSASHALDDLEAEIGVLEEQSQLWEETRRQFGQITEAIDQLARVSRSLQRAVLDTRMVPVAPLFNRFKRVVRDISTEMKKQVVLEIRGENTELDKRMIDELNDPLVHLVRNAIDHGIESAEVRKQSSKREIGIVRLEAAHSGNNVFITVSDDGCGIHVDRVRERIVQRGLVSKVAVEQLTDEQVIKYIWDPGFSTAEVVSDISGRGVGMDIVKTRIARLNGTVTIDHTSGKGTKFTICLPLTLAIIRSLLFRLRHGVFAVPIENVHEIVAVPPGTIVSVLGNRTFEVRGTFIPLVDIDDVFMWQDSSRDTSAEQAQSDPSMVRQRVNVVVLNSANRTIGLQVEELLGVQDIVIKSLSENFVQTRGLSGASILGDGSVCLLLDVAATIDLASRDRGRHYSSERQLAST